MKINLIVKVLIVTHSILLPVQVFSVQAWTVDEKIIELPDMNQVKLIQSQDEVKKEAILQNKETFQFEKKLSSLTTDEQNSYEFRKAIACKNEGKQLEAEMHFVDILKLQPAHQSARVELAQIYLKTNRDFEAANLLEEGLMQAENNPDFLRLMSIVHERKNEPQKALTLLLKVPESYKQNKEYIALLGHIYQQTGRYAMARQQYFRLMQREPKNPIWLLGVSIALEAEGSKEAALEGYKKLKKENIDTGVLRYVEERIEKLAG
jgi:Flp pilus assembly protein TadD